MSLDPKISHAIKKATADAGQESFLANRLITWMEAITSGNADPNDPSDADRRLDLLFDGTEVDVIDRDSEGIF
ncbi:CxC ATPase DNA modification system associated small protein [Streptomyces leeuwenhoekii]|uniref:CxC ATPase DNA modification system associated small protein n=1 Tax=Streptomyces leeuwenhoekii TaxID=1437453 RepID=UPI00099CD6A3|nr:CxC ATPase DNA modification system associated small protein [Streptomyces leeuwenhoekii]